MAVASAPGCSLGHQPYPRQPPLRFWQADPARTGQRRQKQAGNGATAGGRRGAKPGAVPGSNLVAGDTHAVQQQFEMILRMSDGIAAREWRLARRVSLAGAAQQVPDIVIERKVEIGQDHRTLRQARDHPQQPGNRR